MPQEDRQKREQPQVLLWPREGQQSLKTEQHKSQKGTGCGA